ncbi:DSC E3 ubiquitin ligase complex subunit [Penicillium digitatum]|uniref:UBA domain-containing protein Ucp14 n=3 Tax=Penicillium digitatum TaxID=36651 RepID=K9G2F1_PEND2|nr:hypothetical protein PDIP_43040 [Penicillium digitatum Pd1]EKV07396.1 hypothetical protein PDIG_72570 [Penicillium digitatum PHI26]EKV14608.1 hypothetical protein PDIP_43040 [Penicillium digitatum Pd1]QQK45965.1 DSC E3 ubiquitin ligase complex subunit [Penicillium digitatum]
MLTSGLTNAPLTKALLIYTIASSIALSLFDIKHLAVIYVSPHFWPYAQFWRALVWHVAGFTNSTEALFAAMLVYHLRVVERAWGKRKMATFLLTTLPYTTLLPPIILTLLLCPVSLNKLNYLPSGPTATIFALLAQYHATIPYTYRYRIASTSSPDTTNTNNTGNDPSAENATQTSQAKPPAPSLSLLLSDKSTTYIVAAQLALSQFPAMLLPSALGWIVGVAWRAELLPGLSPASTGFRVPAWVVGEQERRSGSGSGLGGAERERYEDLRRRLEGEVAASASGLEGSGAQAQRRANTAGEGGGFVNRLIRDW